LLTNFNLSKYPENLKWIAPKVKAVQVNVRYSADKGRNFKDNMSDQTLKISKSQKSNCCTDTDMDLL
jgi:hypothetical protein